MTTFTRTVVSIAFPKCSDAVRVGLGRPYTVAYSDGVRSGGYQTRERPAPKVGDVHGVSTPYGTPMAAGWARAPLSD